MSMATVILVHGALLASQSVLPVEDYLQKHQLNVINMNVPMEQASLAATSKQLCTFVNKQSGPVIIAAHSQSDAVVSQALGQCGAHISGLIYIGATAAHHHDSEKIVNSIPKFYLKPSDALSEKVFEVAEYIQKSSEAA